MKDIRFIDLRGQDTEHAFAFYTIEDGIITYGGKNCWNSWDSFEKSYLAELGQHTTKMINEKALVYLQKHKEICPQWVFEIQKHINYEYKLGFIAGTSFKEFVLKVNEYLWSYDQKPESVTLHVSADGITVQLPTEKPFEPDWVEPTLDEASGEEQ